MEHSVTAYLGRQPAQVLEKLLEQYRPEEGYYQQFIPIILEILEKRAQLAREDVYE